jgi:glycerol-3-phosphate dehydrogenase
MAVTLSDLLLRRLHLFYEVRGQAAGEAADLAELAGTELGWDAPRKAAELTAYRAQVAQMAAFRGTLRQRFSGETA